MRSLVTIIFLSIGAISFGQGFEASKWIGKYTGIMELTSSSGMKDQINVSFEFKELIKDSIWTYTMLYKSQSLGEMVKNYEIKKVAGNNLDFIMDEKDGIVIDMSFFNSTFFSIFEVEGMIHTFSMSKEGKNIRIVLFGSDLKNPTNQSEAVSKENQTEINRVTSFKPIYNQVVDLIPID